jgi:hypothetical protein
MVFLQEHMHKNEQRLKHNVGDESLVAYNPEKDLGLRRSLIKQLGYMILLNSPKCRLGK